MSKKNFLRELVFLVKVTVFNKIIIYWSQKGVNLISADISKGQDISKIISHGNSRRKIVFLEKEYLGGAGREGCLSFLKRNGYFLIELNDDLFAFKDLPVFDFIRFTAVAYLRDIYRSKLRLLRSVYVENNGKVFYEPKKTFYREGVFAQQPDLNQAPESGRVKPKIVIITAYNHHHKQTGDICASRIRQYCKVNNIDYFIFESEGLTSRPRSWDKLLFINYIFNSQFRYSNDSWVLWIDADAVIVNDGFNLEEQVIKNALPRGELVVVKDITSVNSGVMLIKSSEYMRKLLKQWWSMTGYVNHHWWEQGAFLDLIDKNWENIRGRIYFMRQGILNAYNYDLYGASFPEGELCPESFVYHLPGLSRSVRTLQMRKILARNLCLKNNENEPE